MNNGYGPHTVALIGMPTLAWGGNNKFVWGSRPDPSLWIGSGYARL